ncbi:MAG TPA: hypothetical protein VHG08_28095 [Longimicrobium sp.]|nr:hypothetical protein [Longimicrobium sp.]
MRLPHSRAVASSLLAAALLAACEGGGPTPPPPGALVVTSAGRLERSSVVTLTATRDGQPVPAGEVSWTVTPGGAAEVLAGGQLRLLQAGDVEVRAAAGGRTGTLQLRVAAPPAVVFDMTVNGNRDLYRVALDGGDLTRLTTHTADDRDPSAGGGKVAFVSFRTGNPELWSVPLAGGTETRITTTGAAESAPALSADGQRLAYASDASGVAKVWTAQSTGAGGGPAAPGFGFDGSPETTPSWAPTGNRLAFVGTETGTADIYQLTLGGTPSLLAGGAFADVDPAWSPDGATVAFASTREGDAAIFLVRVSDGVITKLTTRAGAEAEATWTADGRLVYVEFGSGSETRLVWIDPAAPATVNPIPVTGGFPRRPSAAQ